MNKKEFTKRELEQILTTLHKALVVFDHWNHGEQNRARVVSQRRSYSVAIRNVERAYKQRGGK